MQDKVIIEGLEVDAVIGIYDWEKAIQQPLVIDLTMAWSNEPAAASDDIKDALDYEALSKAVIGWVQAEPFGLIEKVAEVIAQRTMQDFAVNWIKVRVAKPTAVKEARTVAVEIERHNAKG